MTKNIYQIPLRDGPQSLTIALSGVVYNLRVRYNAKTELWVLDLADAAGVSMIRGIPLVTGCDLLAQYHHLGFTGALIAYNPADFESDNPPRFDDLDGALLYVTEATE